GVAPATEVARGLRIPAPVTSNGDTRKQLNKLVSERLGRQGDYVRNVSSSIVFLDDAAFPAKISEADAELYVAAAMKSSGFRTAYTKQELADGEVPPTPMGRMMANSYSPLGGWWVMGVTDPFTLDRKSGTNHGLGYSYDQHVPLAFYGPVFRAGVYRDQVEPIDLAPTLAVLLGINKPNSASGRVLTEALMPAGAPAVANPPPRARPGARP
ncbi:MAG: hypothetical protein JOZ29_19670, partial [Deltaproteobacteria bacterium]|nr:hypothetical protein [Deltaproteobacteria bacterium]